jgi:SAM-dependent methyltransferase
MDLIKQLQCLRCDGEFVTVELKTNLNLTCKSCRYSITNQNGVYLFESSDHYSDSFGFQWSKFSKDQLDSSNGRHFSRDRFQTETGWQREELKGKLVLDAGCGTGRFAEIALQNGAFVIAIDSSDSIFEAQRNLERFSDRVIFLKADIEKLPIKKRSLDFLYSIGVLQHTRLPYSNMISLLTFLKPQGRFAFTVYQKRIFTLLHSKYLIRSVTRKISKPALLSLIERSARIWFPLTRYLFSLPFPLDRIFSFMIPVANYPKKKWFNDKLLRREAILDTFDMLSPTHDLPMSRKKTLQTLHSAEGLTFQQIDVFSQKGVIRGTLD